MDGRVRGREGEGPRTELTSSQGRLPPSMATARLPLAIVPIGRRALPPSPTDPPARVLRPGPAHPGGGVCQRACGHTDAGEMPEGRVAVLWRGTRLPRDRYRPWSRTKTGGWGAFNGSSCRRRKKAAVFFPGRGLRTRAAPHPTSWAGVEKPGGRPPHPPRWATPRAVGCRSRARRRPLPAGCRWSTGGAPYLAGK